MPEQQDLRTKYRQTTTELGQEYIDWFGADKIVKATACLVNENIPRDKIAECFHGVTQDPLELRVQERIAKPWLAIADPEKRGQLIRGIDKDLYVVIRPWGEKLYGMRVTTLAGLGIGASTFTLIAAGTIGVLFFRTETGLSILRAFKLIPEAEEKKKGNGRKR